MPRGVLTPEQRARQLASLAALRADPDFEARRLAALNRPEVRARIAAAKRGKPQSPETIAKRAAAQSGKPLSPEHRAKVSAAQKGKTFTPEHLEALRAAHRTPEARAARSDRQRGVPKDPAAVAKMAESKRGRALSAEHREAISRGQVRAYEAGRRTHNAGERYAASLLEPLGFAPFARYGGHAFDFGAPGIVVEVNGCRWHDHRAVKPSCPTSPKPGVYAADEAYRAIARASGLRLVELWACERAEWPAIVAALAPSG